MPGFELGDDLACRWSLRLGPPFQPGGAASWVAPARTAAGDRVVLKVGWWHDEAAHEADGLRAWDGAGTVRLLGSLVTGSTSALPEARSGGSLSPRDSCFAFCPCRVVDTTSQTDRPEWEELTAQALAVPLPYRPQPGVAVYHAGVDDLVVMIAEHDLIGPMLDLVTAVLTLGDHL
jgi:hypothetical protein